jgi:hypothetical protein
MEIELYSKIQNASDMERVANMLGKCGIFGNDKQEFGMAVLLTCASERITPIQFARTYDLISGKIKKKAMAAFAEFRKRGAKVRWVKSGDDGVEAMAEIEFEGVKSEHRFTIEQARRQGLVKPNGNWEKTPGNMLRSRLLSNAIGMLCPEIYAGEDDSDSDAPEAKPLLQQTAPVISTEPTATAKAEVQKPKPDAPIDIPATVAQSEAQPETRRYTVADIAISPETGRLTVDAMAALESVIGAANMPKLIAWLQNRKWITEGLSTLSMDRAKRLFEKPADVLKTIGAVQ